MPSKKRKYNARFPAGRIKKIMQSDEEVGKVAQAVPVIISRTLELFVESLLTKTLRVTNARNAKTLSTSHMKQCIMSENRFDFLRELVKNIPDISYDENDGNQTPNIDIQTPSQHINSFFPSQTQQNPQQPQQEPFDLRINSIANNSTHNGNNLRNPSDTSRNNLKRPWENNIRTTSATVTSQEQKLLYSPSTSAANVEHNTHSKINRTHSLIDEKTLNKNQKTNHKPFLQHQPKSVPNFSSTSSTSYSVQNPLPPPIINIDLNTKPTIKIDYTNIMQQQEQNDKDKKLNNKNSICEISTDINPVINIDLSKIATEPPIININLPEPTQNDQLQKKENKISLFRSSSTLDLDEDYDNI